MTVTVTPIGVGTAEGDDTGDKARVGAQSINANEANFKAAIEELQGRFWTVQNSTLNPLVAGARYMANNHAGITYTTPATFTSSSTAVSDIWITNADDASNITLTPASGDAFFVDGATHGVDTTYAVTPGNLVILSPRTTDSEWDLFVAGGAGGWADMTEAVWAGGTQSEVADGASAVAFDFDTDNAYSTSGAKLASWSNNGTEKLYINKDGGVSSGTTRLDLLNSSGDYLYIDAAGDGKLATNYNNLVFGGSVTTLSRNGGTGELTISSNADDITLSPASGKVNLTGGTAGLTIGAEPRGTDTATQDVIFSGQDALTSASTNLIGADATLKGGDGASGTAGDGHGGDVNINGGQEYGTGTAGAVNIQAAAADPLGFFGSTAVAQPSGTGETTGFTAGSGTSVLDDSTFTGNVGSTAYRINDIVKALKNLGLLAQ